MGPADSGVEQTPAAVPRLDPESAGWLRMLTGSGRAQEAALARLHEMLVRIARSEVGRRAPRLRLAGPELDDLAYQAAADALIAITGKLSQFRGESRFTTWAYKFVIFEVSAKIGRHFWRDPGVRVHRRLMTEELMDGRPELDRFLRTDPRDVGCAQAMDMLHVYAELAAVGGPVEQRYPGITAHLRACGPCGEDFDGLLAALNDQTPQP